MKGYDLDENFKSKMLNQYNNEYGLNFNKQDISAREKIKVNSRDNIKYSNCFKDKN